MARPKGKTIKGGRNGNKKHGRMKNKPAYKRYLANDGRVKRKARKISRYLYKFPNWKPIITSKIEPYLNKLLKCS